mmetsp:Transcript_121694/g.378815  ORF Transcript_121694/g.378815 Transcript_121694/m.378815 type:complete len:187 (-) Transcript_121694:257-817(-)
MIPSPTTTEAVKDTVQKSLDAIGVDYLDLMLIHTPGSAESNYVAWQALEEMHLGGKVRAIGVSNFNVQQMQALLANATRIPIMLNQRSMNVMGHDNSTLKFCLEHNITYQAYTPLGDGTIFTDNTVLQIAQAHGKSAAQIALRWILQRGATITTQSQSESHQLENMDLFGFTLSDQEMRQLNALGS